MQYSNLKEIYPKTECMGSALNFPRIWGNVPILQNNSCSLHSQELKFLHIFQARLYIFLNGQLTLLLWHNIQAHVLIRTAWHHLYLNV